MIKSRRKLSNSSLRREKYNLIKQIKENYNVNDFFNGRISNYRMLASIYNVFQSESSQEQFKPDHIVNSKVTILEHITNKKSSKGKIQEQMMNEYGKSDKDLRLLAYQILVDKFNKKYKNLNESQRKLLKNYINNVSNTNSLREFTNEEVYKIKKELKRSGLGTASIPDTRSQKTRALQRNRIARDVEKKFKKKNPLAYKRLKSK